MRSPFTGCDWQSLIGRLCVIETWSDLTYIIKANAHILTIWSDHLNFDIWAVFYLAKRNLKTKKKTKWVTLDVSNIDKT